MITWLLLALFITLLVLLAEKALLAVTPHELEALRAMPGRSAQRAVGLGRQIRSTLAALLLARLLASILAVTFASSYFLRSYIFSGQLQRLTEESGVPGWVLWTGAVISIATGFAVFVRIFRGIPIHPNRAAGWLRRLGGFIVFWKSLFRPFIPAEPAPVMELTEKKEHTDADTPPLTGEKRELELLKSIVKFSDTTVKQVMQPRSKIVAVDFRTHFAELLDLVREAGFSRLPVFDDDLDNITGILYVKDLLPFLDEKTDFEWQSLIRPNVMLVPESKLASELLEEFKLEKMHLAVVVDEYGGTSGIVTMEDVLEEVTGEIRDEFDEESEVRFRKIDEYNYVFEGPTLLNDVCRLAGINAGTFDAVRGDADTIAGLLLEISGDIPGIGAEISWEQYLFTVTAANNRRIEQVKLTLPKMEL